MDNPWGRLPDAAPFVLDMDAALVLAHNNRCADRPSRTLDVMLPPDPFVGRRDAPVMVLALNPGVRAGDHEAYADPGFRQLHDAAITDQSVDEPFFYLSERLRHTNGWKWWNERTKELRAAVGHDRFMQQTVCVQYLPYHSMEDPHLRTKLPSQDFAFAIVKQAMKAGRTIVVMRSHGSWFDAVPGLEHYPRLLAEKRQRAAHVSLKNMLPGHFERLTETYLSG